MNYIWIVVIMSVIAYFIGNLTFARIIVKKKGGDITKKGSGNPGTTNTLRNYGAKTGFLVFFLDFLKGVICAITAFFVCGGFHGGYQASLALYVVGAFCVVGHVWPVIFKFKGGKGVATAGGVMLVANPIACVALVIAYWVILYFKKIPGSIMSLGATFLICVFDTISICIHGFYWSLIPLWFMAVLIFFAHRTNIKRIFQGKESKMDLKAAFDKDKENKSQKMNTEEKNSKTDN